MTDKNIQVKEAQIDTLRELAEKETAWLEKNRLLYTEKKVRLERLIEERSLNDVEITLEEQCLTELKSGDQNRA